MAGYADLRRVRAFIVRLLARCRPAAVARLVVAVVIDAVNRMAGWAASHICHERHVVIAPAVTDHNAAPAVVLETLNVRVVAAGLHRAPRAVLSRSPRLAMRGRCRARLLFVKTPARACFMTAQVHLQDGAFRAAVAATEPAAHAIARRQFGQHRPVPHARTGQVDTPGWAGWVSAHAFRPTVSRHIAHILAESCC